jgi:hypothetical protein
MQMFFKQFYLQGLGHASYLVGSEQTGEALLFGPQRHVDGYFAEARMQGLRIPEFDSSSVILGVVERVCAGQRVGASSRLDFPR